MNRKAMVIVALLFIFGCGASETSSLGGTDIGNPDGDNPIYTTAGPSSPGDGGSSNLAIIVMHACDKIAHECHLYDENTCSSAMLASTEIDRELGLPRGRFSTLNEASLAEMAGEIHSNADATASCVQDIHALSCDSPELQGFLDGDPNVYHFESVIPHGACQDVF